MKCKKCSKEIVFIPTNNGKYNPVNLNSLSEQDLKDLANNKKILFDHTRHVSHFSDCPDAYYFKKKDEGEPRLL